MKIMRVFIMIRIQNDKDINYDKIITMIKLKGGYYAILFAKYERKTARGTG